MADLTNPVNVANPGEPVPVVAATTLAQLTTLGVGGPIGQYVQADSETAFVEAVRAADASGQPVLVLGGGSNIFAGDAGFPGVVIRDSRQSIRHQDGNRLVVAAGTTWTLVVQTAVAHGLAGIEALAGIPGTAGATPVQNVGAYGQEVAQTISSVRVWDRATETICELTAAELRFNYRASALKATMTDRQRWFPTPRFVVLEVVFDLVPGPDSRPVGYSELAARLGVEVGGRASLAAVHDTVLELRRGKGMVLDPADPDTRSAGSFFTNPLLGETQAQSLPAQAPRYPTADGRVKTSAAWLIQNAGFARGFGAPGRASLSTKHVLALTNRGNATAGDVLAVARTVRDGVLAHFGVELEPEPVLVGVDW